MAESGLGGRTLVILPTYNEAGTLAQVAARTLAVAPGAHLLIIDDASPDGTGEIADSLAAADPRIFVAHRTGKQGLGTAYLLGFRRALDDGYRYAVEMDSDGSHLPEELPELLAAAAGGAGLVMGARWIAGGRIEGWPYYRRCISRAGTLIARLALRSRLNDITSGYRVLDTGWLAKIDLSRVTSQGYGFQVETAWTLERIGCPIAEVPITFVERRVGRSKMSLAIVLEAFGRVLGWGWKLRFFPERLG